MNTKDETTKYVNVEVSKTLKTRKEYTYKGLCDNGLFKNGYTKSPTIKKAQFNELAEFAKFTNNRGRIKFSKFYEEVNLVKPINSEVLMNLEAVILDKLAKDVAVFEDDGDYTLMKDGDKLFTMVVTPKQLYGYCNLVCRCNYGLKPREIAEQLEEDLGIVRDAMMNGEQILNNDIKRALLDLNKRRYMNVDYRPILVVKDVKIDENGKEYDVYSHEPASDLDRDYLLKAEKKVLSKLDCIYLKDALLNHKATFNSLMKQTLDDLGAEAYYYGYRVSTTKDILEEVLPKYKLQSSRAILNKEYVNKMYKSIQTKHINALKGIDEANEEADNDFFEAINSDDQLILDLYQDLHEELVSKKVSVTRKNRVKDNYIERATNVTNVVYNSRTRRKLNNKK